MATIPVTSPAKRLHKGLLYNRLNQGYGLCIGSDMAELLSFSSFYINAKENFQAFFLFSYSNNNHNNNNTTTNNNNNKPKTLNLKLRCLQKEV